MSKEYTTRIENATDIINEVISDIESETDDILSSLLSVISDLENVDSCYWEEECTKAINSLAKIADTLTDLVNKLY